MPNGNTAVIGTIGVLKAEFEKINSFHWQADNETIRSWIKTEGYVADSSISADGQITRVAEYQEHNTESLAKYAFTFSRYSIPI